jgi:hypothetical protein
MNFTFLLEIFPHTCYGVLKKLYTMHPLQCYRHWNMIEPHDEQIHRESMLMPLLFTSYENYVRSSNSFFEGWNWMEGLYICQKQTKYGQSMFCEAVKVDMENSKKLLFHNTITSTLSLITVLFEDLFEAIFFHREFSGEKVRLEPLTSLLNKTDTCDGYVFNIDVFTDEVNALQKVLLVLFEGFCIFGYREAYKKLLCILMVVNKTIYGNNVDVPDILLNMFLSSSPGIRNHMNRQVVAPDPEFQQSYRTILNKQEFIIHNSVTRPIRCSLSTLPTMSIIYDKPGAGWDRIDIDDYFTSYFKTNEVGDAVQQEKNLQHHNSWKRITLL